MSANNNNDENDDMNQVEEDALLKCDDEGEAVLLPSGDEYPSMNEESQSIGSESQDYTDYEDLDEGDEKSYMQFKNALEELKKDRHSYEEYDHLCKLSHATGDIKLISKAYELFARVYPLSPELWLKYLRLEINQLTSGDVMELEELLQKTTLNDTDISNDIDLEISEVAAYTSNQETTLDIDAELSVEIPANLDVDIHNYMLEYMGGENNVDFKGFYENNKAQIESEINEVMLKLVCCPETIDHDALITQFQYVMDNQLNEDAATFFLEMTNWHLAGAVGCYMAFHNFQNIPSMKVTDQCHTIENKQIWRLNNIGTEKWPTGCYLMSPSQVRRIDIPALKPKDSCFLMADMPAVQPDLCWRLCTPKGWYFGNNVWMIKPGTYHSIEELTDRMSTLRAAFGTITPEGYPQINMRVVDLFDMLSE